MNKLQFLPALILAVTLSSASENRFDAAGNLDRVDLAPGWLDLAAGVRIPAKGWGKMYAFDKNKVTRMDTNDRRIWQARLGDGETSDVEIVQTAAETNRGMFVEIVASAFKDSDIEGVIYWIDFPADTFAGGTFQTIGKDGRNGSLPAAQVDPPALVSGTLESVRLESADKSIQFAASFGGPANCTLQDSRKWSKHFSLLIHAHSGAMLKGQTARFTIVLNASGKLDRTPAEFKIDAAAPRFAVRGLGGNYCFNLDTPEKNLTLDGLNPQFARTEISLQDWLPERGAAPDPSKGKLPREFAMMRELAKRRIPFIASVWNAPAWMCLEIEGPGKKSKSTGIKPEMWPDMITAAGNYLLYAKANFNAEADYFSFNETDYGAKIKMTPQEHRDLIKHAGTLFEKLGLKTHCVLGDVSNPRTSHDYLQPALDDPAAMKYVGAVSFHSWGGATPEQYAAWGDLAQKLKLPLIVAEVGVDPDAWRGRTYTSFDYFVREAIHYQQLFQFARPQVLLYWEYTADYSLFDSGGKGAPLIQSPRYLLQKHWLDFVPSGSEALTVSGTNQFIALTAFRNQKSNEPAHFTLELSNTGWPRSVRITGLPAEIKSLNRVVTTRGINFESWTPVTPADGAITLELPGQSMTTLSN